MRSSLKHLTAATGAAKFRAARGDEDEAIFATRCSSDRSGMYGEGRRRAAWPSSSSSSEFAVVSKTGEIATGAYACGVNDRDCGRGHWEGRQCIRRTRAWGGPRL